MGTTTTNKDGAIVVSALSLRTNLGRILRRTEAEVLKIVGIEAKRNKTDALTSRQIEKVIKTARSEKKKR
jgi:hypothetical protein